LVKPTYSVLLFISGAVSLTIAGIAWRRRPSVGAAALAVTMISMVIWSWMYGLFWIAPTRSEKFIWLSLAFIGVVITSPAFLVMAVQFSGKTEWPTRRIYILLAILPSLVLLSLWTEPWFDLFSRGVDFLDPKNSMQGGLGFGLSALNANGTTFIAAFFLLRSFRGANRSRREQIVMILVGTSLPFIAGYISILKISPFPDLDLTPIVFSLSGICYVYAMFGYKMMDLAPMGRESVIEEMDYGVLVVDHLDRIIDINPSVLAFLDANVNMPIIGKPLKEVLPTWIDAADLEHKIQKGVFRLEVEGESKTNYDISISQLVDEKGDIAGYTYIWRDISKQKSTEEELRNLNAQLESQLHEIKLLHTQLREKTIQDSLTVFLTVVTWMRPLPEK
jgi:PAS domain-containing protein